jgi:hypothetical protein
MKVYGSKRTGISHGRIKVVKSFAAFAAAVGSFETVDVMVRLKITSQPEIGGRSKFGQIL